MLHPASRRLTYVNVYDAPYELPDSAIEARLRPYGKIFAHRRGKFQGYPDVFNGVRHLRIALEDDIPCFLRFGRFQVRVKYENQPKTCRKCNSPDHIAKECTSTVCYNCDGLGHLNRDCPQGLRCCICKSEEHVAVDCVHSWYRRPQAIDTTNDPVANAVADVQPPRLLMLLLQLLLRMYLLILSLLTAPLLPSLLWSFVSWIPKVRFSPIPLMRMRYLLIYSSLVMMATMVRRVQMMI